MKRSVAFVAFCLLLSFAAFESWSAQAATIQNRVPGTGMLSGKVAAPKPFKAAHVYAKNLDKNVLYMVFTSAGQYQAVGLFPGEYEVWVEKRGFESDRQKVRVESGGQATLDFALRDAKPHSATQGGFMGLVRSAVKDVQPVSYDELYPPSPIRPVVERTCITCHGKSFLTFFHFTTQEWDTAIGRMMDGSLDVGVQIPPGTISAHERTAIAEYLSANFGPGTPDRVLKVDVEMPVDEQALSKAMYVEYLLPLDKARKRRWLQEVHIDHEGNVWYTERIPPSAVGKVDPRTAQLTEFDLPDPNGDPHGMTIDSKGNVFWAEARGGHLGRLDPKTGKMARFPISETKGMRGHTPVLDSKENVWFTVIIGNKLARWDRATEKIRLWEVPTHNSYPYGLTIQDDKLYLAEFHGCKVAKFDPETERFTEYLARQQPCTMRRLGADNRGAVWYGVFSQGRLGRVDIATGEIVEYDMASRYSEPYDVWPDRNSGQVWMSDAGLGGSLVRFDPKSKKFTYYPSPRRSDMPKTAISRDGAIWYSTRALPDGAVGVLYPDMSRITTLAALR